MPMTQGTVTVSSNGTVTKSGFAGALYDALVARWMADGNVMPSGAAGIAVKKAFASMAGPFATIVGYIHANAVVRVPADAFGAGVPATEEDLEIL
jgi:hypothetical protein